MSAMTEKVFYISVAFILGVIFFIVPQFVSIRVRVLRWIHWTRLADWHQRNFKALVAVVRIMIAAVIAILIILTISS